MRLRAQRLFVIAGVTVITALLLSPHFERGEHAAHLHRAIRAGAGHHGKGVGGQLHFHFAHIGHLSVGIYPAALAVGQEVGADTATVVDAFLAQARSSQALMVNAMHWFKHSLSPEMFKDGKG